MKNNRSLKMKGYTMVELMLAMVTGAVIMAALLTAYTVIGNQQMANSARSDVQEMGMPALRFVESHLRRAGYTAIDSTFDPVFFGISSPIAITDSGNACCDEVTITHDTEDPLRRQVRFYVGARTNPDRNALYMDIDEWDGLAWSDAVTAALVADYIEDFQVEVAQTNSGGFPVLVDTLMVYRAKKPVATIQNYSKPAYTIGNYSLSVSDNFLRDEFEASTRLRNITN